MGTFYSVHAWVIYMDSCKYDMGVVVVKFNSCNVVKFACDKSKVITIPLIYMMCFSTRVNLRKKILNILKHQIFWNLKHEKIKSEGE